MSLKYRYKRMNEVASSWKLKKVHPLVVRYKIPERIFNDFKINIKLYIAKALDIKFSENDKTKFDQCAKIINDNLSDLIVSFDFKILDKIKNDLKSIGISSIDYCEVRSEDSLDLSSVNKDSRLFIAFYLNAIRIIDNFILY